MGVIISIAMYMCMYVILHKISIPGEGWYVPALLYSVLKGLYVCMLVDEYGALFMTFNLHVQMVLV